MKYALVSGSHRKSSQSEKVARFLENRLKHLDHSSSTALLTLGSNPLPLWDEEVWNKSRKWAELWSGFSSALSEADALVFVVPEWGGMVPPAFKNFLLLCSHELKHKPALLVTVSSGIGGSYPISELRMSGYKNTYVSYLPEHLIIRKVETVLNDGAINEAAEEGRLRERIDHMLKVLGVYGKAYQQIRATKEVDLNKYPTGM